MAAVFSAGSNQVLVSNTFGITVPLPRTVGMWVRPTTTSATRYFFNWVDGSAVHGIGQTSGNAFFCTAGSTATATAGSIATDWFFVIGRHLSTTDRRISVLAKSSISSGQNTDSQSSTASTGIQVGARNSAGTLDPFTGSIAELWCLAGDVQPDGGALQDWLLWHLAYNGPLGIPHIAPKLVHYQSFRQRLKGPGIGDFKSTAIGRVQLNNVNGVTYGPHPPIPEMFHRPNSLNLLRSYKPAYMQSPAGNRRHQMFGIF